MFVLTVTALGDLVVVPRTASTNKSFRADMENLQIAGWYLDHHSVWLERVTPEEAKRASVQDLLNEAEPRFQS